MPIHTYVDKYTDADAHTGRKKDRYKYCFEFVASMISMIVARLFHFISVDPEFRLGLSSKAGLSCCDVSREQSD